MTTALRFLLSLFAEPTLRLRERKPTARRRAPHRQRRLSNRVRHHRAQA